MISILVFDFVQRFGLVVLRLLQLVTGWSCGAGSWFVYGAQMF